MFNKIFVYLSELFNPFHSNPMDYHSDLMKFSYDILSPSTVDEAERLAFYVLESKPKREYAIEFLQHKIGLRPKRPLYYVSLLHLPRIHRQTRDIVRYLGDYLDGLVKCTAADLLNNNFFLSLSMGVNLWRLKNKVPDQLLNNLSRYNKIVYVPAKHDFKVSNRPHLFTSQEAVFVCFLTVQLAEELKSLSSSARLYCEDKLPEMY